MNLWHALRLARLVRHRPSKARIITVAIVLGASAVIAGYEWLFGWPNWLTVNDFGGSRRLGPRIDAEPLE